MIYKEFIGYDSNFNPQVRYIVKIPTVRTPIGNRDLIPNSYKNKEYKAYAKSVSKVNATKVNYRTPKSYYNYVYNTILKVHKSNLVEVNLINKDGSLKDTVSIAFDYVFRGDKVLMVLVNPSTTSFPLMVINRDFTKDPLIKALMKLHPFYAVAELPDVIPYTRPVSSFPNTAVREILNSTING